MKKNSVLKILLELVFVIIFNVIFFLFGGTNHELSVWISYGFIMLSYLMVILTQFMIRPSKSAVLGLSIYSISTTYFILEFVVGLIFVFMKSESWKVPLAVQLVLFGIYLISLISNIKANENTINNMERQAEEVSYIKNASSKVKLLVGKLDDKRANKTVEHVYDILHASPTRSNSNVFGLENSILGLINSLQDAVYANNIEEVYSIANNIEQALEERNRKLQ